MTQILARCGYRCDLCLAYKPNIQAHPENAQVLSDGWHTYFGFRIPPERILCEGCLADTAETLDTGCPVRPCVIAHGFETCAQCPEYICPLLAERIVTYEAMQAKFANPIPPEDRRRFIQPYENKPRLDRLHEPYINSILLCKARDFSEKLISQEYSERAAFVPEGRSLAEGLRRRAIDLAQSRGTEFDPDIPNLHLWAAKLAVLVFDQEPDQLQAFENDILYYQIFPHSESLIEDYLGFKLTNSKQSE